MQICNHILMSSKTIFLCLFICVFLNSSDKKKIFQLYSAGQNEKVFDYKCNMFVHN